MVEALEKTLTKKFMLCVMLVLLILLMVEASMGYEESLTQSIREVYSKLANAEEKGADVSEVAHKLEKALELVRAAQENPEDREVLLAEAMKIVDEVNSSIPLLIKEGEQRIFWRNVTIAFSASLVVALAALTYYYGPRLFWESWLKLRSHWIVEVLEKRGREAKKP